MKRSQRYRDKKAKRRQQSHLRGSLYGVLVGVI